MRICQYTGNMKKNKVKSKTGFPALILFMVGFLLGNLIPNLLWRLEWRQKTISSLYLINTFAGKAVSGKEYLKEVLRLRAGVYLLSAVCGFSIFGAPLAVMNTIFMGLQIGLLLTMPILEFGFLGGLVGISLLFPQYLIYIPVMLYLMTQVYNSSMEIWKSKSPYPKKPAGYILRILAGAAVYMTGILMECYLNPYLTEKALKCVKLF